ncbi:MAG TPA: hypothetical protein DDZ89_14860 [Clostridiales bacterium]|nr:hypothetical protein [Clostridiales bacterium]
MRTAKLLRRVLCVMMVLVLAFSITGCARSIMKGITGGLVDIDKDGNVKIKGEDGQDVVFGTAKWDKSKMHGLSQPKCELTSYMSTGDGTLYTFSDMKEKEAESFINELKKEGFDYTIVVVDEYSFLGTHKNGSIVNFTYDKETEEGSILAGKGEAPTGEKSYLYMGSAERKWDSKEAGGLPDPGEEISDYYISNTYSSYSFNSFKKPADYIKNIKNAGYTERPESSEEKGYYYYAGYNKKGDFVTFISTDSSTSLTYTKAAESDS